MRASLTAPVTEQLLTNLFAMLKMEGTDQSEYCIKCIVRTVAVLQEASTPFIGSIVNELGNKMMEVSACAANRK